MGWPLALHFILVPNLGLNNSQLLHYMLITLCPDTWLSVRPSRLLSSIALTRLCPSGSLARIPLEADAQISNSFYNLAMVQLCSFNRSVLSYTPLLSCHSSLEFYLLFHIYFSIWPQVSRNFNRFTLSVYDTNRCNYIPSLSLCSSLHQFQFHSHFLFSLRFFLHLLMYDSSPLVTIYFIPGCIVYL